MPVLPPWIKAADPASHMAAGMHIGVQIGAQQAEERFRQQQLAARQAQAQQEMDAQEAAQRFKEVQAAKNEQMAARDQALAEQKFSLAASAAAQKHQAMQEYQAAVSGGMDPNEAMLKWGPAMAANTGAAAAIRAHERETRAPKTWNEVTLPSGLNTLQSSTGDIRFPPKATTGTVAKVPEGAVFVPESGTTPAHWTTPKTAQMTAADREKLRANRSILTRFANNESNPMFLKALKKSDPKAYEDAQNEARAAAEAILEIQPNDPMAKRYAGKGSGTKAASSKYKTAAEVAADYKAGHISRDDATKILKEQFGVTEAAK